jgi:UDP-N-acetylglucosamine--N-acetylmuramyl-(pentapeptide) pyrophosphoryl-undecaprenol N-acetylglucosamine transferase
MVEFLYVGIQGGIEERIAPAHSIPLVTLKLTTPDGLLPTSIAALQMGFGVLRSLREFLRFRPQVLFSTGGFVSVPATVAAWLARIPVVVYLPDVRMGRSVALTAPFARRIAVTTDESLSFLKSNKASVTGYPVRTGFLTMDRVKARERLGIGSEQRVVLVMGGSLGAQAINRAIVAGLPELLEESTVIHVCGPLNYTEVAAARSTLPEHLMSRYRLEPFFDEEDMAAAMFAADVAVTRAGASILGELPAAGLPAVVVPLPAARVHQDANATALSSRGACIILANHELANGSLTSLLLSVLTDKRRLGDMRSAMEEFARPNAADDIARIIVESSKGKAA